ncbi:hypothetical protein KP509_02G043000 [Ceratopteris richardii]|uniref:Pentatricopeptide repeat-containing protein n=1 Tax=Ceratopteris richardii TaxID=49495 RepID=A0A8T2V963_CERRI|nr:hypothetical protein KP509_02G043000 [Ceratopteris richardii]
MKKSVCNIITSQGSQEAKFTLEVSIVNLLKGCIKQNDIDKGRKLHAEVLQRGLLRTNIFIGSRIVQMYASCCEIRRAQQVFDEIHRHDLVCWNTLIAGYVQTGYNEEAFESFSQMRQQGLSPSSVTFCCILKACGNLRVLDRGQEIHTELVEKKLLEKNAMLGAVLVDMYMKCGAVAKAEESFSELLVWDTILWNVLIKGYVQHGYGNLALECLDQMKRDGLSPNPATFLCALQACSIIKAIDEGKKIHCEIARQMLFQKETMLGTALLDMYGKCGAPALAQEVFDMLPVRDTVSWNALLLGYFQNGYAETVFIKFKKMQQESVHYNTVTLLCALQACSNIESGIQVHAEIARKSCFMNEVALGNALVHMYANFGALTKAQEILEQLSQWNIVALTALIAGYCQHGHGGEALKFYEQMGERGIVPDAVTHSCILLACGTVGAAEMGKKVHAEIIARGFPSEDCILGSSLVDMYAKCGAITKAQEVFNDLPARNVDCWTTIITAFAKLGKHDIVFALFNEMVREEIQPNIVTFVVLLYACGSLGLVNKGGLYFELMCGTYGIVPTVDHCRCMVDLFGRLGHIDRAIAVVNDIPSSNYLSVWIALLDACKKSRNMNLGMFAFEHLARLGIN